ncbi:MAG: hypothetical protein ACI4DP_01180 [Candidatus Ornithomonoglobus sp.]
MYTIMFKNRGIMPDVTARQTPRIFLQMLNDLYETEQFAPLPPPEKMTDEQRMLYGY